MNLNADNWGTFVIGDIFNIVNGKGITKEEIENNPGELIAVQSGEENNGCFGRIDKEYCQSMSYVIWDVPCLTVARTGSAGFVSYQKDGCVVGDSAKVLDLKDKTHATDFVFIFLQTILSMLRFKYTYGRKVTEDKYSSEIIKLPITEKGEPDWVFMEKYIKSLHHKPITTKNKIDNILNLEVNKWMEFEVGKIFIKEKINKYSSTPESEGDYEFISSKATNNGVYKKVDETPIRGNCITVSTNGECFNCFYHDKPIVVSSDVEVLYSPSLNRYSAMFICGVLEMEKPKWSYERKAKNNNVFKTIIKLPVTNKGEPDWEFMEEYIKSLPYGDKFWKVTCMNLNANEWGKFKLSELFDIKKGKRLTTADQIEGTTVFIGAIDSDNGVSNYIGQEPIHDGNTISLSYNGSVGEAFYQPKPFWATDDINVLYFKESNNYRFNKYLGFFICAILRQEKYRFSYGKKWKLESMNDTVIKLPITPEGSPDWLFMEKYIKSLHHKPITTKNGKCGILNLEHDKWGSFNLDDIFEITKAFAYDKNTFEENSEAVDKINCITRTVMNNGCAYKGEKTNDLKIETGNALTIGGEGAVCFYQEKDFVCGTNMTVLRNDKLNKYTGLFLCGVINHYSDGRFSYGRAFNMFQVKKSVIKLPVNSMGEPDWEFMEEYIKSLPYGDRL